MRPVITVRCIDFETTGFPPKAGVCEIGWTDVTVTEVNVSIGETVSMLCNPGLPIGPEASKVHGITDEMVRDEIPSSLRFKTLLDGADFVCAHNAEFERNFFTGGETSWICTYKAALVLHPSLPTHRNGDLPKHLGLWLDATRCEPLHRAGPDTYVTAVNLVALIMKAAEELGGPVYALSHLAKISSQPRQITVMPFGKHKGTPIAELPIGYVEWGAASMDAKDVAAALQAELQRRRAA